MHHQKEQKHLKAKSPISIFLLNIALATLTNSSERFKIKLHQNQIRQYGFQKPAAQKMTE
jgi:hypothetical protein